MEKSNYYSPLRYAGSKRRAIWLLADFLPRRLERLISPFFGGGSFEIACAKELNVDVIGYDIFDILINYWNIQIDYPEILYSELASLEPNRNVYTDIKKLLASHWNNEIILPSLELAVAYYFNHNLSYGPSFLGWPSSVYLNEKKYYSILERVKNFSCDGLSIFCDDFENSIPRHNHDFLYCDPPYFLGGESKIFHGIYPDRNNPIHHKDFNHITLWKLLLAHKGKFLLSYNDCPEIRKLYKDFRICELEWQYSMGQGETRLGKGRMIRNMDYVKESHEILIMNY